MAVNKDLLAAADLLESCRWGRKGRGICATDVLKIVTGFVPERKKPDWKRFAKACVDLGQHLGLKNENIVGWNDRQRSKRDVVRALRSAGHG